MPIGYLQKELTPEGAFSFVFHSLDLDNPTVDITNLRLWMTDKEAEQPYFIADGFPTVDDDGEPAWGFSGNTLTGQKLLSDGSLETNGSTAVTTKLEPGKVYLLEVTYEDPILGFTAIGIQQDVLINPSLVINRL